MKNDFVKLKYKYEYVTWFLKYYNGKYKKSVFTKKNVAELRGWYYNLRNSI